MNSDPKKNPRPARTESISAAKAATRSGGKAQDELEPTAARNWVPLPIIFLLGLTFFWCTMYLDRNAGGFNARVYEPFNSFAQVDARQPKDETQMLIARGKSVYEQACGPCHQPTGLGLPGQFPPLAGSEWVTTAGPGRMIRIALYGLAGPIQVKGQQWNNVMPAVGEALSPEDLAAALSYARNAWGNKASVVKADQVKAVKAKVGGHGPMTAAELNNVPETD
jgi:mono/diheme cytochrome c family protein